jgi:hypothetical protein
MDLSTISDEVRLARGDYATVRAAHEDAKKAMQVLCGQLSASATQILRAIQPADDNTAPEFIGVDVLFSGARDTLTLMEACAVEIEALAKQRAELRPKAWGKR